MTVDHDSRTTIDFLKHFTSSEQFERVFREGMALVEETASYLDGPGRREARLLDRHGAVAYATESMRLTTRLMQLASWLLLQRAIGAGEMSAEEARKQKHRINLADIGRGNVLVGSDQLPAGLLDIIERSLSLHQRVMKLDVMLDMQARTQAAPPPSPVIDQIDRIAAIFKAERA